MTNPTWSTFIFFRSSKLFLTIWTENDKYLQQCSFWEMQFLQLWQHSHRSEMLPSPWENQSVVNISRLPSCDHESSLNNRCLMVWTDLHIRSCRVMPRDAESKDKVPLVETLSTVNRGFTNNPPGVHRIVIKYLSLFTIVVQTTVMVLLLRYSKTQKVRLLNPFIDSAVSCKWLLIRHWRLWWHDHRCSYENDE